MSRARALKQAIRARAARTGERYTTARRHVLRDLKSPQPAAPAPPQKPAPATATPQTARTGISEARVVEKTGHDLDYWFEVLDRFGATAKGHTAAARHLAEEHGGPFELLLVRTGEGHVIETYPERVEPVAVRRSGLRAPHGDGRAPGEEQEDVRRG